MNLLLRLAMVLLGAPRRSRLDLLAASSLPMRVWPTDLDVQMHMNNGRYLSLMDLGRIDLLVRSGFWREARLRAWFPLVGASAIEYRRPLRVFERYQLTTRLLGWDERWFYVEQSFRQGDRVAAVATVKAMIRSASGTVPPLEALAAVGVSGPSPGLPEHAALLARARPRGTGADPRAIRPGLRPDGRGPEVAG